MSKAEFLESFRQILGQDPGTLSGSEALTEIGWDSLAIVQFLAFADEQFGRTLSAGTLRECKTPDQLFALLTAAR